VSGREALKSEITATFRALHVQLKWPYPNGEAAPTPVSGERVEDRRSCSYQNVAETSMATNTGGVSRIHKDTCATIDKDLCDLIKITHEAECYGWFLLLCALTCDYKKLTQ
jgi:hypothetical protein